MAHAEELCQHVVMIHKGRKVLDEPMAGLRRQFDPRVIRFEPLDAAADLSSLRRLPGVERDATDRRRLRAAPRRRHRPGDGDARRSRRPVAPARIELARVRLEDVFIRLVAEARRPTTPSGRCAPTCRASGRKEQLV